MALNWNASGADIVLADDDLLVGNDLQTAVLVSLFSDGRDDTRSIDKRGWWSDFNNSFGSLLWLLDEEKTTLQTAARAKSYCQNALQWLIDQKIASKLDILTELVKPFGMVITIYIYRGSNKKYDYAWNDILDVNYIFNQTGVNVVFR